MTLAGRKYVDEDILTGLQKMIDYNVGYHWKISVKCRPNWNVIYNDHPALFWKTQHLDNNIPILNQVSYMLELHNKVFHIVGR